MAVEQNFQKCEVCPRQLQQKDLLPISSLVARKEQKDAFSQVTVINFHCPTAKSVA